MASRNRHILELRGRPITIEFQSYIIAIMRVLDALGDDVQMYRANPSRLGREIYGIAAHDRHKALTRQDMVQASKALFVIQHYWSRHGSRHWTCEEVPGPTFTLLFRRKKRRSTETLIVWRII